ncbi:MAG TPA: hypothetical protein VFB74_16905 [Kribbellaceae bacterium]|nr:hypothetical protein [Kribbellaceae bacterium]
MELLQGDMFDELFRSFERTAFHLELQDSYHTPEEAGPFDLFLRGERDDFGWHQSWLQLVQRATQAGKRITRARVVSVPHHDYTRWGLTVAPLNIEAGEDIRWLPRHLAADLALTTDDYWLFDDNRVVFTIFEPGGRFGGGAQTVDPVIVEHCRRARDLVWARAIPHHQYVSN